MHKTLLILLFIGTSLFAQQQTVTFDISPATFEEEDMITITASGFNPSVWGVTDVYLWAWSTANGVERDAPNNGEWTN